MEKRTIYAAILGLGTVGTGTWKVLQAQKEEMQQKLGAVIEVKKILVRNTAKAAEKTGHPELVTDNWSEIAEDPSIEIVIELIGGLEPARTYIKEALEAGKHVVTANKDLLAADHGKLLEIAKQHGCDLMFEAAVAGAIPVILPLKQSLAANHLTEVMGIINGTTNFILTKMAQEGMEFADALALATKLGYAEADPTADIEGLDAARKVAILASIAFHSRVSIEDVKNEGITKITANDIRYANEMGCCIKLIGMAHQVEKGIEAYVAPMLIPSSHPLAAVNDSYNAVFVRGDAVDNAMFLGRGAGELPTASAVVGDVFETARNIVHDCCGRISCTCYKQLPIVEMDDVTSRYFVRVQVEDKIGVLAMLADTFAQYQVSVEQMIQKRRHGAYAEIVVITARVREGDFRKAVDCISKKEKVQKVESVIRVYGED